MSNFEHDFPFERLPKFRELSLRRFDAAAEECTFARQVPYKLAYFTAAAACCAAAQALVDISRPAGGVIGTNVYALIVADSGERKTAVRRDFFGAFDQIDIELKSQFAEELSNYEEQLRRWHRKEKALAQELKSTKGPDKDKVLEQMDVHDSLKPIAPIEMRASLKEPGMAPLKRALSDFPCASIISGDCANYLREVVLPNDTMFCDTWSGEKIDDPRITVANYYCENPRLSTLLMAQEKKFESVLKSKNGKGAVDSGYFGRTFFCNAGTTQGSRFLELEPNSASVGSTYRDAFTRNIKELLQDGITAMRSTTYQRKVLRFSEEAASMWKLYHNYVEEQRGANGRYHKIGDFANKLPDNVARMAAAFHVTERFEGDEIGMECLMTAILMWDESSKDYAKAFDLEDQDEVDARYLYDWLDLKLRREPCQVGIRIAKEHDYEYVSTVSRLAPLRRMRGQKVHRLLDILVRNGFISIRFQQVGRRVTAAKITLLESSPQFQKREGGA